MADTTDVTQLPTDGPGVNAPASGTYGEGAALERLKKALPLQGSPGAGPAGPAGPSAPPMPTPQTGAMSTPAAPGVPPGILSPTDRPGTPVSTPLAQPPMSPVAAAQTGRQARLAILDALAADPQASGITREWAATMKAHLIAGSTG